MYRILFRILLISWFGLVLPASRVIANDEEEFASIGVTLLQLDDATRSIMEHWPPSPLDMAVLFLNLQSQEPAVIGVTTPLAWPDLEANQLQVLKRQMAPLTTLVGMELDANAVITATSEELNEFAKISNQGAPNELPSFKGMANRPSEDLCASDQLGFTEIDFGPMIEFNDLGFSLTLIARSESGELLVSLPLLTAIKVLQADLGSIRWSSESELILTEDLRLPMDKQGRFEVPWELESSLRFVSVESISPTSDDPMPISDDLHQQCVILGFDDASAKLYPRDGGTQVSYAHLMALAVLAILNTSVDDVPEAESTQQPPITVEPEEDVAVIEAQEVAPPHWSEHPDFGLWLLVSAVCVLMLVAILTKLSRVAGSKKKANAEKPASAAERNPSAKQRKAPSEKQPSD